jgi:hypothetical protein
MEGYWFNVRALLIIGFVSAGLNSDEYRKTIGPYQGCPAHETGISPIK